MKSRPKKLKIPGANYLMSVAVLLIATLYMSKANGQNLTKIDTSKTIKLWPENRLNKNANDNKFVEHSMPDRGDSVIRLTNISDPTIKIYKPVNANGTAVIVCPGGGYSRLSMNLEGEEICNWFNTIGVTGILLKYRVPAPAGLVNYQLPLQDAQRALGLVRYNAIKWGIKPDHIGIMGFSAGGHLSAALSNNFSKRNYPAVDAADEISCRPDFAILIYPAYLTDKNDLSKPAPEIQVTNQTPPTFLMQTEDDPVHVENSLFYYLALKKAKVPAEIHLYSSGGHGYGFRSKTGGTSTYPHLIEQWLATNKF